MSKQTEEENMLRLATHMRDTGKLNPVLYHVWKLHREGYTFFEIRNLLRDDDNPEARGHAVSTLHRWYHRAQAAIEAQEDREREGRPRLGNTLERNGEVEFVWDTVLMEVLR